jgi:hypothetical protein
MPGDQTVIPMKKAAGGTTPTLVNLPDATTIFPASGQFWCPHRS